MLLTYAYFINSVRRSFIKGIKCPNRGIVCGIGRGSLGVYVGDVYHRTSMNELIRPHQMAVHIPIILSLGQRIP